ncbi:Galactose oxidase/kelch beta-propeller [Penicillium brevicompactum]|uniref:Galactose oxidase/kelch beta-propeller n=1 Tax=Penicillium brevicompactum TaxID=5074 RepID=A0A9W9UEG3_PENBR|nr:Galactose oxidase/kelch beta-propeller [Penicillium brevicompactum]
MGECSTFQTQINVSMCNWQGLRATVLHDTLYLDGGKLWYQRGYDDGCVGYMADDALTANLYYLNLSTPFNTSSDFMSTLSNMSIAGGAATNIAPNYVSGSILSNDNEFYLYGGMSRNTDSSDPAPEDRVLSYDAYQYGAYKSVWAAGWTQESLSENVTRLITNGAAASAPSENLGFYFSGMRASDWGEFTLDDSNANVTADTLITVDMSTMRSGEWSNTTLPSYIPGRSNAELVWVPVSDSGVLVAIGGVIDPISIFRNQKSNSTRTDESKAISPTFMDTVSLFDVESKTWYLQNTTGDIPPQLTEFCSVLASAADGSSHNIYIYGGYNGLEYNANPSDDVYILSLPSFRWIKAYSGTSTHSRSGHRCLKVYPDQMLVVGGQHVDQSKCLEGGVIVDFNLNTLKFQDKYDPTSWGEYKVPDLITAKIGGNSDGGATTTAPSSWTNSSLAGVFDKKYSKTVETYWPYSASAVPENDGGGGGFPGWAGAIIGVVLGLLIIAFLVGFWLYRRRRNQRQAKEAENEKVKEDENKDPPAWMYGGGPSSPGPGPTSTSTGVETTETSRTQPSTVQHSIAHASVAQSALTEPSSIQDSIVSPITPGTVESGGDEVYEMHDSSPVELPTAFNVSYFAPKMTPQLSPKRGSSYPISPMTPETDSEWSWPVGHHRRPSSLSLGASSSIDDILTSRTSHFHETFENGEDTRRARHGSEISESSDASNDKGRERRSETIHEDH